MTEFYPALQSVSEAVCRVPLITFYIPIDMLHINLGVFFTGLPKIPDIRVYINNMFFCAVIEQSYVSRRVCIFHFTHLPPPLPKKNNKKIRAILLSKHKTQ